MNIFWGGSLSVCILFSIDKKLVAAAAYEKKMNGGWLEKKEDYWAFIENRLLKKGFGTRNFRLYTHGIILGDMPKDHRPRSSIPNKCAPPCDPLIGIKARYRRALIIFIRSSILKSFTKNFLTSNQKMFKCPNLFLTFNWLKNTDKKEGEIYYHHLTFNRH